MFVKYASVNNYSLLVIFFSVEMEFHERKKPFQFISNFLCYNPHTSVYSKNALCVFPISSQNNKKKGNNEDNT